MIHSPKGLISLIQLMCPAEAMTFILTSNMGHLPLHLPQVHPHGAVSEVEQYQNSNHTESLCHSD